MVIIRARTAMAPMTIPAMAPAGKAVFEEGINGGLVEEAEADNLGVVAGMIESGVTVAVAEDKVVIST